jgi:hypothetical protein
MMQESIMMKQTAKWLILCIGMIISLSTWVYLVQIDQYAETMSPTSIIFFWISVILLAQLTIMWSITVIMAKKYSPKLDASLISVFGLGFLYASVYVPLLFFIPTRWAIAGNAFFVYCVYPVIVYSVILFMVIQIGLTYRERLKRGQSNPS